MPSLAVSCALIDLKMILTSQEESLWCKGSALLEEEVNNEQYYVGSLMPPLEPNRVVTGSKLRRMSEIPGRGNTTVLVQGKLVSVCGELLVHLFKCTIVITCCPLYICPSLTFTFSTSFLKPLNY